MVASWFRAGGMITSKKPVLAGWKNLSGVDYYG
jgi:hypothetical protein